MRNADRCIQKAKIIVNLSDRSHSRAGTSRGGFLLNGNGRRKTFNGIDVRRFKPVEELPRIGGQRFDVPTLTLRVDGVEGQTRFSGTAKAGDYSQFVARNFDVNALEIVLPSASNSDVSDGVLHSREIDAD